VNVKNQDSATVKFGCKDCKTQNYRLNIYSNMGGKNAVFEGKMAADTITLDSNQEDFLIKGTIWEGKNLYQLYQEAYTPWEWHRDLFAYAQKKEITIFSSPFDSTAIDLLEDINAPAYKIASFEAIDLPLIKYAASTGKPLIISTGMANADEIGEAIEAARVGGCKELAVLHCVSGSSPDGSGSPPPGLRHYS